MCGITGLLYFDHERAPDPHLIKRMTDIIAHRGPDDDGIHLEGPLGLGARRLSIVGLTNGRMPMSTADEALWVVFNGEIYNHPQLRNLLQAKGHVYRFQSDTESLLHAYREWGDDFVSRIEGMFALALWDRAQRKLILARDRLGVKPLYYHLDDTAIRFGSEIKSILCDPDVPRRMDLNGLNHYLAFLSASAPYTLFDGIRKLMPGEMLIIRNSDLQSKQYWTFEASPPHDSPDNVDDLKRALAAQMREVVQKHLLSDVPVGAFLSGGIDSSLVVALMNEAHGPGFKTFAIGFEGNRLFDETPFARQIADLYHTDHHEWRLSPNDLLNALDDITWQLDEPLADSSCLPVYYVSKLAAEHVKVVLSGDGGDEIFAGYRKYQGEHFRRYVSWLPNSGLRFLSDAALRFLPESRSNHVMDYLRQVKKFLRGLHPDPFERHLRWAIHFEDELRWPLLTPEARQAMNRDEPRNHRRALFDEHPALDALNRMLWVDLRHNLPDDMLMKVDRMSMLHSLEVRVPFLDHQVVESAFTMPSHCKLHGGVGKWILKEAFKDKLPASIVNRRKHGFDVPVGEWFRAELREMIEDAVSHDVLQRRGLFDPTRVRVLLDEHLNGNRDYNNQLWMLLSLELWQRQYLDAAPGTASPRPR